MDRHRLKGSSIWKQIKKLEQDHAYACELIMELRAERDRLRLDCADKDAIIAQYNEAYQGKSDLDAVRLLSRVMELELRVKEAV